MWVISKHGFVSIVMKDGGYNVRARRRADLEELLSAAKIDAPIIETPSADYRWRAIVQAPQLVQIMHHLGSSIDYPNFKDRMHEDPVRALYPLGQIWNLLAQYLGAYGRRGSGHFLP